VQLKVDGKLVFYKTLERGRSKSWQAKQKMELSLGNAGGVEMEVNAQHIKNLGKRGQPIRNIVITEKEGLKIPR
jgi:hypothetical protein